MILHCALCGGPLFRRTCLGAHARERPAGQSRAGRRDVVDDEPGEASLQWRAEYVTRHGARVDVVIWRAYRVTPKGHAVQVWPAYRV